MIDGIKGKIDPSSMEALIRRCHHEEFLLYKVLILITVSQTSLGISPSSSISSILVASRSPFDDYYLEDDIENEFTPMDYSEEEHEPNQIWVSIGFALCTL